MMKLIYNLPVVGFENYRNAQDTVIIEEVPYLNYFEIFKTYGISSLQKCTFNPSYAAQIALYNISINEIDVAKKIALELIRKQDNYGYWLNDFPFPPYDLKPGFRSAMTQGVCISLMLELFDKTNDYVYARSIEKFLRNKDEKVHSTIITKVNNTVWFEEYPSENNAVVLNGALFLAIALLQVTENAPFLINNYWKKNLELFLGSFPKLGSNFKSFWGSKYCLYKGTPSPPDYHILHRHQLKEMYRLTGNDFYLSLEADFEKKDLRTKIFKMLQLRYYYWIQRQMKKVLKTYFFRNPSE